MKRIGIFLLMIIFCESIRADTIDIVWLNNGLQYDTSTCTIGGDLILPTPPTKRGYTFTGWEFALPYVPVEYIDSNSGTIDTKINGNKYTYPIIETKFQMLQSGDLDWFGTTDQRINWNYETGGTTYFRYGSTSSSPVYYQHGYGPYIFNFRSDPHTLKLGGNTLMGTNAIYVDNILVATLGSSIPNFSGSSGNILIGGVRNFPLSRWYSFKISDESGNILFNGIPVRENTGRAGMFDTVSSTFFCGNTFTAGPDITE